MPRRSMLSASERENLVAVPDDPAVLTQRYELSEGDLSLIRSHRGQPNRLGFAVQLCYMRFPGMVLGTDDTPSRVVLEMVAGQLKIPAELWSEYGDRAETRREHLVVLQQRYGYQTFTGEHQQAAVSRLAELASRTDKGILLAEDMVDDLRKQKILLPSANVIERICAEAVTLANRRIYEVLTRLLTGEHRERLDRLLTRKEGTALTWLAWLRQSPSKPNSRHMLEHIERLEALRALDLPTGVERLVHQNRLLKIARDGGQMTPADLAKFEPRRRYATLVAVTVEATATVTDQVIDLHDRIIGSIFAAAKNRHKEQFHSSGRAINDKVRLYGRIGEALLEARRNGV